MESGDAMFPEGNPPGCQPSDCCGDPSIHKPTKADPPVTDGAAHDARLVRYAKATYEFLNPGFRWEDAAPDDKVSYLEPAEASMKVADAERSEPQPLSGATVLQSGDRVLLCMASEPDSDTTHAICKQLTERYPNVHFGLVTGVTGVLIDRGNDDASLVRKADES